MKNKYELSCIDLFAGAGGLSLGLEQAGFSVKFANEINPNAALTYMKNRSLPKESIFIGDVAVLNTKFEEHEAQFKNTFLVCGGPPCQGFSTANRQRLIDDPRNRLYLEYLKFLKHVKPHFFIMENVRGMTHRLDEVIDNFYEYLGQDYNISYGLLNAKDFSIPQNRERLFIIGNNLGISTRDVFFTLYSSVQQFFTLNDAIADLPELKPNSYKNNTKKENEDIGYFDRPYVYKNTEYANFINDGRTIHNLYNHKNRYNNERDIEIFRRLPQGGNSLDESIKDIMPYASRNHMFKDKYYKLKETEVSKTITSHMKNDCNMYIHPTQPRGLSPREAARIQTFPDDYVFYGPQNGWYLQVGNAVPVKLAEKIGRAILSCLN
ncbi:MAG: DNA cytosine methyltransferase [Sphaerochaeta sp.]|nr:DNA cytosine methyltransferase [Sphaerochaeta sp.]